MNTAVTRLYALLVALTLTALVAWAVTDWFQLQEKASLGAQAALRKTAGLLTDWAISAPPQDPTRLAELFRSSLVKDAHWKMLLLTSPSHGTEYYRGPRTDGDPATSVPTWSPRFPRELLTQVDVFLPDGQPWVLKGVYEFYTNSEILKLLRASGLTLLVLVLLTTLLVLIQSARKEPTREQASEPQPSRTQKTDLESADDEYWFDDELDLGDLPPLNSAQEASAGPSLLAPSGLSWAHFLEQRLNYELERCAGNNQDLTLLLLGGTDLQSETLYLALAQEVRSSFPSLELDFETKDEKQGPGVAVVLPHRSLETAMAEAQTLVGRIDRLFPQIKLVAGAASRAGRLLGAATVIKEASSALGRARHSSTRVVGLKTDPERYREHVARSSEHP